MSKQAVQFNVRLSINDGKFDAFEGIARAMTAGTLKEEGALGYEWYLSGDRKHCHLIEDYKDTSAVQAHLESAVARELVPQMLAVSRGSRDVAGEGSVDCGCRLRLSATDNPRSG